MSAEDITYIRDIDGLMDPIGAYSQVVTINEPGNPNRSAMTIAGMIGVNENGELAGSTAGSQSEQILKNLGAIKELGSFVVLNVLAVVAAENRATFASSSQGINAALSAGFKEGQLPTRAMFPTPFLPKESAVEMVFTVYPVSDPELSNLRPPENGEETRVT